jgi:GDPmannose 4,6-dehydratase
MKRVLITGITGQDGSYLADLLVSKGYEVYGLLRRTSNDPFVRINHLVKDKKIKLIYGNMRDRATLIRALEISRPDEVYNLAAQSHVGISFDCPDETWAINFEGAKTLAEETFKQNPKARFYQASTSEMYGSTKPPQNEMSIFAPVSPYADAKLKIHNEVVGVMRKQGHFICAGILFNHESPRRGENFVTRKVTQSFVKIKFGLIEDFELGNLESHRDWGFAGDYVEAMWMMLQRDKPEDFVIATGESRTVREMVEATAEILDLGLTWHGSGMDEVGKDNKGNIILRINKDLYRPNEVDYLLGDPAKAKEKLGWKPKISFKDLIAMMVIADQKLVAGFQQYADRG